MSTSQNWLLLVYEPDMTFKTAYSWTDSSVTYDGSLITPTLANIQQLQWFVTPNEDSLDATWLGDSNEGTLNINPHDRIVIATLGYRTGESTSEYVARFRGYASIPANRNHTDGREHQYRALGISRLFETTDTGINTPIDEGQDLATVADAIIDNLPDGLPAGVTHTSNFDNIGVTNTGKINADSTDLAQSLNAVTALAATASVTAVWGVKPDGSLFFEPLDTSTLTVTEGAAGTHVDWLEPQADEIITAVRWVLVDGTATENSFEGNVRDTVNLHTPDVATYRSESGITTYGNRVIALSPPSDVQAVRPIAASEISVTEGTLYRSFTGGTQDGTADVTRASDNDPTSYIVVTPSGSGTTGEQRVTLTYSGFPLDSFGITALVLVTVNLRYDPDSDSPNETGSTSAPAFLNNLAYIRGESNNGFNWRGYHVLWGRLNSSGVPAAVFQQFDEVDASLVFGDRSRVDTDHSGADIALEVTFQLSDGGVVPRIAIQDFRIWVIDRDLLDALAEQEYRLPQEDALSAILQGERTPRGLLIIDRFGGTTLSNLVVEAFGTSITGERGVETLVRVGPRTPPAVTEEHNRVRRRDRLAALSGAKAKRLGRR